MGGLTEWRQIECKACHKAEYTRLTFPVDLCRYCAARYGTTEYDRIPTILRYIELEAREAEAVGEIEQIKAGGP